MEDLWLAEPGECFSTCFRARSIEVLRVFALPPIEDMIDREEQVALVAVSQTL